jgi:cytochrome b pre-mRNA-processing protein 3
MPSLARETRSNVVHLRRLDPLETDRKRPRLARMSRSAAVTMALLATFAVWIWSTGSESRAIQHLAPVERRSLYTRTLRTLESPCRAGKRPDGLTEFCAGQARFVLEFPECDPACATLARKYLPTPAR